MVRLVGSFLAWLGGAGPLTFLTIWVIAAIMQAATQWIGAILINGSRIAVGPRGLEGGDC